SDLPVTVCRQAAQAFTNVPHGTRLLSSLVLGPGSGDDSWHAATPSCLSCPDRLRCAKSDGGSDSLPLRFARVDRTPHLVPLEPSIRTRSGCDPAAFGPVANPAVLPGTVPTPDRKG